jgi:uncharacterized membrane protein
MLRTFIFIGILFLLSYTPKQNLSPLITRLKTNDTLLLYAQYSECGEWGGHEEYINITPTEKGLLAVFSWNKPKVCKSEFKDAPPITNGTSKILNPEEKTIISSYISDLADAKSKNEKPSWNMLDVFTVHTKDSTLEFENWNRGWKGFEKLRNKVFR